MFETSSAGSDEKMYRHMYSNVILCHRKSTGSISLPVLKCVQTAAIMSFIIVFFCWCELMSNLIRWIARSIERYVITEQSLNSRCAHIVWKSLKMSHLNVWILAFSTNFCPIKADLSGNTVWPQALRFQKLAKIDHFWHFKWIFVN